MFIIYFSRKGSKTWRCGESRIGGGREGEKEGRDSLGHTHEHSVTLSHSLRATQIHMFMPVFLARVQRPCRLDLCAFSPHCLYVIPPRTHTFTHFCSLSAQPKTCLHIQYTKRVSTLKFLFMSSTHKACFVKLKNRLMTLQTYLSYILLYFCVLWPLSADNCQHITPFKLQGSFSFN